MSSKTSDLDHTSRNRLILSPSTNPSEGQSDAIGLGTPTTSYTDEGRMSKEEESQQRAHSPSCEGRSTSELQQVTSSSASDPLVDRFLIAVRTAASSGSKEPGAELYRTSVELLGNKQAVRDLSNISHDIDNGVSELREALNAMQVTKSPPNGALNGYKELRVAAYTLAKSILTSSTSDPKDQ